MLENIVDIAYFNLKISSFVRANIYFLSPLLFEFLHHSEF